MASIDEARRELADPVFGRRRDETRIGGFARVGGGAVERAREPQHQRDRAFDLERHVGQHRAHHRLVVQMLLENVAMAAMMHGLRQRHAHQARRGDRAIEPRQLHHLHDGAHARALVADPPARRRP